MPSGLEDLFKQRESSNPQMEGSCHLDVKGWTIHLSRVELHACNAVAIVVSFDEGLHEPVGNGIRSGVGLWVGGSGVLGIS